MNYLSQCLIIYYIFNLRWLQKQDLTWNFHSSEAFFEKGSTVIGFDSSKSGPSLKLLYESICNHTSLKSERVGFWLHNDLRSKSFPFLPTELMHCFRSSLRKDKDKRCYFHLKGKLLFFLYILLSIPHFWHKICGYFSPTDQFSNTSSVSYNSILTLFTWS